MNLEYFQMVDRITDLNLGDHTITADCDVPTESTIFEGHFPGHPIMPGVLLIEAMAQTSGWLIIASLNFERMPFLAAVKEAKMRAFISPAAKIEVSARIIHEGSGFAMTSARITHDGKVACNATLTFRHTTFPTPGFRDHMVTVANRIGLAQGMPANV